MNSDKHAKITSLVSSLLAIRFIRFCLTGGVATLIHICVAFTVLAMFENRVFSANVAGFSTAFCFSYAGQSLLVFKQPICWKHAWKFFAVQFCALLAAQLASEILTDINSYVQVIVVVAILPIITYLVHKLWTFSIES